MTKQMLSGSGLACRGLCVHGMKPPVRVTWSPDLSRRNLRVRLGMNVKFFRGYAAGRTLMIISFALVLFRASELIRSRSFFDHVPKAEFSFLFGNTPLDFQHS